MYMKLAKFFRMAAVAAVAMPILTSCLDDNGNDYPDYYYPNAIVTVKPNADNGDFYIQVDDENTAKVTNLSKSPFGEKEVRAIANITKEEAGHEGYDMAIKVNWIDSILTKKPVAADAVADYGDDRIGIYVDSFFTLVEDGYLNIHFRTQSGNNTKHWLNLLLNTDPENPYLVEFRQKTEGEVSYNDYRDGFVAFRLKGYLPDTGGKEETLTLQWKGVDGTIKTKTFKYCTPEEK